MGHLWGIVYHLSRLACAASRWRLRFLTDRRRRLARQLGSVGGKSIAATILKARRALWGFGGIVGRPRRPRNRRETRPA